MVGSAGSWDKEGSRNGPCSQRAAGLVEGKDTYPKTMVSQGFPGGSDGKESTCNA